MNCPKCDMFTPDDSTRCENCGHTIPPQGDLPRTYSTGTSQSAVDKNKLILGGVAVGVILLLFFFMSRSGSSSPVGSGDSFVPGEPFDISLLADPGQITIFDFYSDFCPPCRRVSPLLDELDEKREDIVVKRMDINREGVRGIDFTSPLARQYKIRFVPYFIIFNEKGKMILEGKPATSEVVRLLQQENIRIQ